MSLLALEPGALAAYFSRVQDAFEAAARRLGRRSYHLSLAGDCVAVTFAGAAPEALVLPALAHRLAAASGATSLEVAVWDSASCGVPLPPPPWPGATLISRGELQGYAGDDAIEVAFQPGSGVLMLYDSAARRAVAWVADAGSCPYWEFAAPLRGLWHWWHESRGRQLVHGAAVGGEHGAVLLTGKGGSGKSSTALAALLSGMYYLGDDYVVCEPGPPPVVHSLYSSAKLDEDALVRMPALAPRVALSAGADREKAVLLAGEHFPGLLPESLPLRAIVVPRVGAPVTVLEPLGAAAAFLALAPTTVFQLPGADKASSSLLRELVIGLPCYTLTLGPDPAEVARVLQTLVQAP